MTYSYIDIQVHIKPNGVFIFGEMEESDSPHNKASLRSLLTLPYNLELDTAWYYVDNVPSQNTANYNRFDVRFGWQARKNFEFSLGARNIFDNQHQEFSNQNTANSIIADEVRRVFYLQMQYQF
jgi:iron complex outermembrane receptor protein